MPADLNNPIPAIPEGLLQMLASVPSKQASGQNAFTQNFFPGLNNAMGIANQGYKQKNQQNQISQLLQQLRGGQPQMPQGQPQAQAPMPNPMQQSIGQNSTMINGDPLGLFGPPPMQAGGGMGMSIG
jgi:hypothetical protein